MVAAFRANAEVVFSDEVSDAIREWIADENVSWRDQLDAAAAEMKAALPTVGTMGPRMEGATLVENGQPDVQFKALLAAGIIRCLAAHSCEHALGDRPRPSLAFLGARVISCSGCGLRFEAEIEAQDARVKAGLDNTCDLCLEDVPDRQFRPLRVQNGPTIVFGDVCEPCFALAGVT